MKLRGLTTLSRYSSSPAGEWPETCTLATSLCTTTAPARDSWLMTRYTAVSLPGTSELASTTVSPAAMVTWRWSPRAIRPSALIGSPCDPVDMSTIRSRRQLHRLVQPDHEAGRDPQQPEVAGDAHVAHHRATDEGDHPVLRVGRVEDLLDAVHVRGERRHDDAAGRLGEDGVEHGPDLPLGRDEAGDLGVGRVGQQQVDPGRAEAGEAGQVGEAAVQRQLVHLEVAGVQHGRRPAS